MNNKWYKVLLACVMAFETTVLLAFPILLLSVFAYGCITADQRSMIENAWTKVPTATPTPIPTATPMPTPVPQPTAIPEPEHSPESTVEVNNRVVREMAGEYNIEVVDREQDDFLFLDLRQREEHWEYCYQQWNERTGSWDNFPTWRAERDSPGFTSEVR